MKKKLKTSRVRETSLRILLDSKKRYAHYHKRNPNNERFRIKFGTIESDIQDNVHWFSNQLENVQMSMFCEKQLKHIDIAHPIVQQNFDKKGTILVKVSVLIYGIPVEMITIPFNKIWIKEQK